MNIGANEHYKQVMIAPRSKNKRCGIEKREERREKREGRRGKREEARGKREEEERGNRREKKEERE